MVSGRCTACESQSNAKCCVCGGSGINIHLNADRNDCENCHGTGICPECGGTGGMGDTPGGIQTLFGSGS
jgi:hypothetical protein